LILRKFIFLQISYYFTTVSRLILHTFINLNQQELLKQSSDIFDVGSAVLFAQHVLGIKFGMFVSQTVKCKITCNPICQQKRIVVKN